VSDAGYRIETQGVQMILERSGAIPTLTVLEVVAHLSS
jgi:hypothetical protein